MPIMRGGVPTTTTVARRAVVPRAGWRETPVLPVLARGLLAGAAGVAAMTLAEKLEQAFTGRPDSYVPAHTPWSACSACPPSRIGSGSG